MVFKRRKKLILAVGLGGVIIFVLGALLFLGNRSLDHLRINEIAFSLEDQVDWIEIYNPTQTNLLLKGYYLTDKADNFTKFRIEDDVIVPAKGFVVIYCEGYEGEDDEVVTNFRITNGETIYLIGDNGQDKIDSMTALVNDSDDNDMSVGRYPDGNNKIYMMSNPTLGEENEKGGLSI